MAISFKLRAIGAEKVRPALVPRDAHGLGNNCMSARLPGASIHAAGILGRQRGDCLV